MTHASHSPMNKKSGDCSLSISRPGRCGTVTRRTFEAQKMPVLLSKRTTRSSINILRANSLPLLHTSVPERKHDVFDSPPISPDNSVSIIRVASPIPLEVDISVDASTPKIALDRTNSNSKKARRKLTSDQVRALESLAVRDDRPSLEMRRRLAEELQL